jgi:hypothetical protein
VALASDVGANDRDDFLFSRILNVEGASLAIAFNESKDGVLVPRALADFHAFLPANIGFVNLNNTPSAAHWGERPIPHNFTDIRRLLEKAAEELTVLDTLPGVLGTFNN